MTIPIDQLSSHDYKIIEYVSRFPTVTKSMIIEEFDNKIESVELRLSMLSQRSYTNFEKITADSGYIVEEYCFSEKDDTCTRIPICKNSYHISPYGKKILQDYLTKQRLNKRSLWLKNAWIPIMVAFATTVLTNYILPMLPQMIKWLYDTLEKTFS